jgi:Gpi18-like mannosyltransferase
MKRVFLLFSVAFIFRVSLIFLGFHGDMNNQISWGTIAYQSGLNGFYEGQNLDNVKLVFENGYALKRDETSSWTYSAPNQPPLTILLLTAMAGSWFLMGNLIAHLNNAVPAFPSALVWFWEQKGMILLMKLPGIVADLGVGYLLYRYTKQNEKLKNHAFFILFVWLFNPIVWYNSSVWGQTDSLVNLLGFLSVFAILRKKLQWGVFWFTLSVLFKGSLTYFAPILFFVALFQQYPIKDWLIAAFYSIVPIVLVSLWFHPTSDLLVWLFTLYTKVFIPGEIGYLTANAFNVWWLIDSGKTYDSVLYFGIPARVWGFVVPVFVILWQIYELRKGITDKKIFFALAITACTIFLFMTRIHERYLYPFFPYATLLLAYDKRFLIPYAIISFVHLLNLYHLFWVPSVKIIESSLITPIPFILSLVTIVCYFMFILIQKAKVRN